jgi:hypothetical protein
LEQESFVRLWQRTRNWCNEESMRLRRQMSGQTHQAPSHCAVWLSGTFGSAAAGRNGQQPARSRHTEIRGYSWIAHRSEHA